MNVEREVYEERIRRFTGKYEGDVGALGRWLINRFYAAVIALIPTDARTALEIGCGAGFSTARVRRDRPDIALAASDVDPQLVALARKRVPDVPMVAESIYKLGRATESFDLVVALEVLEHLDQPDVAIGELHRVARRGAILSVPSEPLWRMLNVTRGKCLADWGNTPGHVNHWSPIGFRRVVSPWFAVEAMRVPIPWTVLCLRKRFESPIP